MKTGLPPALLLAHLLYLWLLPSVSARAVTGAGLLILAALVLAPRVSRRFAACLDREFRPVVEMSAGLLAVLACLPLIALFGEFRIAFWRVDGRAWIILAWLAAVSALVLRRSTESVPSPVRGRLPIPTQLFILWSSLFWFMLVWDVGVGQAAVQVTREDRFTTSFAIWESQPAADHLFLIWMSRDAFEQGIAYTNHLHPFTLAVYAWTKLLQLSAGVPLHVGRNLTPFAMAALGLAAFVALIPRRTAAPRGLTWHATLFLGLGVFLMQWYVWVYPYTWGFDTIFPIIAYLTALVWASARPRIAPGNAARVLGTSLLFAAFGWVYTPVIVLALWCLFARPAAGLAATIRANRPLAVASMAALALGALVYALPLLLTSVRGYDVASSSFLFRSGLDGDTRYFQNALQAVLQPFRPARTHTLLLAFVPFVIALACAWRSGSASRRQFGRDSVFLLAPYGFSLALFPQSVSIHPNLYDFLLLLPVVLVGTTWMLRSCVQRRLGGAAVLAGLLLAAVLIMGNLIAIAQGLSGVLDAG
jgi:hypothetical protein